MKAFIAERRSTGPSRSAGCRCRAPYPPTTRLQHDGPIRPSRRRGYAAARALHNACAGYGSRTATASGLPAPTSSLDRQHWQLQPQRPRRDHRQPVLVRDDPTPALEFERGCKPVAEPAISQRDSREPPENPERFTITTCAGHGCFFRSAIGRPVEQCFRLLRCHFPRRQPRTQLRSRPTQGGASFRTIK